MGGLVLVISLSPNLVASLLSILNIMYEPVFFLERQLTISQYTTTNYLTCPKHDSNQQPFGWEASHTTRGIIETQAFWYQRNVMVGYPTTISIWFVCVGFLYLFLWSMYFVVVAVVLLFFFYCLYSLEQCCKNRLNRPINR